MIALLLGVPGVGKSSLAEAAKDIGINVVNYGDVFFELAKKLHNIEDRDKIREILDEESYLELHRIASKEVLQMDKPMLLDTHATIATPIGFMPGFPEFVLEELPISLIVIVEADPEEIRSRRDRDPRRRGIGVESDVELHQSLNRIVSMVYSVKKGCPVYIIKNREGKLEDAKAELREVLLRWKQQL